MMFFVLRLWLFFVLYFLSMCIVLLRGWIRRQNKWGSLYSSHPWLSNKLCLQRKKTKFFKVQPTTTVEETISLTEWCYTTENPNATTLTFNVIKHACLFSAPAMTSILFAHSVAKKDWSTQIMNFLGWKFIYHECCFENMWQLLS